VGDVAKTTECSQEQRASNEEVHAQDGAIPTPVHHEQRDDKDAQAAKDIGIVQVA
jgi:hypothetical protein